jgi:putative tryptophan/tyrosine transport system substrate-binding protein
MRRRDFTIGLLAAAVPVALAQHPAKQHRIAIVISAGPATRVNDPGSRYWQEFWEELRHWGDVEGQNLTVERYSGEGRPEGFAELAREVVGRNPDVIVAIGGPITQAVSAATGKIAIVASGDTSLAIVPSLARPGGNITGVRVDVGPEIYGKRLQILKEAVPLASKVAFLDLRTFWESAAGQQAREQLRKASQILEISLTDILVQESTSPEYRRVFAEIAQDRPDAIIVSDISELVPYRQLIVELVEQSRLPAMYPFRLWVEAGGLMAYGTDLVELWRRIADDVHEILNGANPGDIPIYQPTKFEFLINLKASKELGITIPAALLARADEVIE